MGIVEVMRGCIQRLDGRAADGTLGYLVDAPSRDDGGALLAAHPVSAREESAGRWGHMADDTKRLLVG